MFWLDTVMPDEPSQRLAEVYYRRALVRRKMGRDTRAELDRVLELGLEEVARDVANTRAAAIMTYGVPLEEALWRMFSPAAQRFNPFLMRSLKQAEDFNGIEFERVWSNSQSLGWDHYHEDFSPVESDQIAFPSEFYSQVYYQMIAGYAFVNLSKFRWEFIDESENVWWYHRLHERWKSRNPYTNQKFHAPRVRALSRPVDRDLAFPRVRYENANRISYNLASGRLVDFNVGSLTSGAGPRSEPASGGREKKSARVFGGWLRLFVNGLSESIDLLRAVFYALPADIRNRGEYYRARPQDMAAAVWNHWRSIDLELMVRNIVVMQIQDAAIGQLSSRSLRSLNEAGRRITGNPNWTVREFFFYGPLL